jgi:hypothetical protein
VGTSAGTIPDGRLTRSALDVMVMCHRCAFLATLPNPGASIAPADGSRALQPLPQLSIRPNARAGVDGIR